MLIVVFERWKMLVPELEAIGRTRRAFLRNARDHVVWLNWALTIDEAFSISITLVACPESLDPEIAFK